MESVGLEDIPLPAVLHDPGRGILAVNRLARDEFGLAPADEAGSETTTIETVPEGRADLLGLCKILRPDRPATFAEVHGHPSPTGEGRVLVLLAVGHHDSTHTVLTRVEASFRALADQIPGALFRYRIHPDGTDTVVYMSTGCLELWEVGADAIREDASVLWNMVDAEDIGPMRASVLASARTMEPWRFEWRITTPSGRRKWLSGVGRPRSEPDGTVEWNSFITDVTERRLRERERAELESQLRRAARMESVGRLAGGVAHDFNNMLTIMRSCTEAALELAPEGTELRELLEEIESAARRSADLTKKLLTFARPREGAARPVDLLEHVRGLSSLLERLLGGRGQLVIGRASTPGAVLIDPSEVDQLLTNLVANARDASPDGVRVQVWVRREASSVVLEVADDGPGICDEAREHLFEPFFSTKGSQGPNAGLGLATVYAIVQRRGGTIEVESQPGLGARFSLYFPVVAPEPAVEDPAQTPPSSTAGAVLVVDDEAQVRMVSVRILRSAGFDAVGVASGAEALAALEAEPDRFDVLLTDMAMPEMSGRDLVERVARHHPRVGCVLMSGHFAAPTPRPQGDEVPILEKPFSLRELTAALDAARTQARAVS